MIEVPLGKGPFVALIDDDDEWVMEWSWNAVPRPTTVYVLRWDKLRSGRQMSVLLHRQILKPTAMMEVDHRNGDGLDNRKSNLRLATHAENSRNRRLQCNNTSGVRGVHWSTRKQKWRARIKVDNRYIELGCFEDLTEAAAVREQAALKYYGEFQRQ
jgi:hypothetical protein